MNINNLPPICGNEFLINELVNQKNNKSEFKANINSEDISSGFACALHMHQPTIPAGKNGELISHL